MTNHPNRRKGYSRSHTQWHSTTDELGRQINYITSDEVDVPAVGICSINDPTSPVSSYRLDWRTGVQQGFDPDEDDTPAKGLIVLGSHKGDRPNLHETTALSDIKGQFAATAVLADLKARTATQ